MRRSKSYRFVKQNNKGMTLVEVIVAIAILATISFSLLRAFSSSAIYNKRAKEKQCAVNLAQSIMEGFKAYDLEEICCQFNGRETFRVYMGGCGAFSEVGRTSLDAENKFVRNEVDDTYRFAMTDVDYNGSKFDVDITLTPDTSQSDYIYTLAEIPQFNKYNDAIVRQKTPTEEMVYVYEHVLDFLQSNYDMDPTATELTDEQKGKVKIDSHKITVLFEQVGGVQYLKIASWYNIGLDEIPFEDSTGAHVELDLPSDVMDDYVINLNTIPEYKGYDNSVTGFGSATMKNAYIYYYPLYDYGTDVQMMNVGMTGPVNIYLIKQETPGMSLATLTTADSSYRPSITLPSGMTCTLYTNVATNLVDGDPIIGIHLPTGTKTTLYDEVQKVLGYNVDIKLKNKRTNEEFSLKGSMFDY